MKKILAISLAQFLLISLIVHAGLILAPLGSNEDEKLPARGSKVNLPRANKEVTDQVKEATNEAMVDAISGGQTPKNRILTIEASTLKIYFPPPSELPLAGMKPSELPQSTTKMVGEEEDDEEDCGGTSVYLEGENTEL